MPADIMPTRLLDQARQRPDHIAYKNKVDGQWRSTTYREYADLVNTAARSLIFHGLKPGDSVAILGFNRPEWCILDLAAMMVGGVPAGIYTTSSPSEVSYIVNHCEAPILLVENRSQWEKVEAELPNLPALRLVILMEASEPVEHDLVVTWATFMGQGAEIAEGAPLERLEAIKPEDLATLIYTSGTTGPPKGVMLCAGGMAWTGKCLSDILGGTAEDHVLSYLPLCHVAEQLVTLQCAITCGFTVWFAESIEALPANLKEVRPTIFLGVPRIWEKFYAAILGKLAAASFVKKQLLSWAQGVGVRAVAVQNEGGEVTGLLKLQYGLADRIVYGKLRDAIGLDRLRVAVSGAAPLSAEIQRFFSGLDIAVREVYGQSEDNGPTTFNVPGATRYGTVGRALPEVEVRIADDGEILVQGPHLFLGYLKDQAATDATLIDGWLYSGDLGSLDEQGYLTITGRKKEIIVTAGGKNIAPKNLEAAAQQIELVNQCVVIGDRRKFISALVTLEPEALERFAEKNDLGTAAHEAAAVIEAIQHGIDEMNQEFARVEHIRKFTVLPQEFSVERGELTPTLKKRRKVIHELHSDAIEAMYS